jgi:long-subunit fatty acid transport protein
VRGTVLVLPLAVGYGASSEPLPLAPIILPSNYERTAIGQFGALEGGAVVASIRGSEAGWYNPAGLANMSGANLSASASVLQMSKVEVDAISSNEATSSFKVIPSFFGSVTHFGDVEPGLVGSQAFGFSVTSPDAWSQTFDTRVKQADLEVTYSGLINSDVVVPALSYSKVVNEQWRVGVALEFHYFNTEISSIQTTARLDDMGEFYALTHSMLMESWGLSAGAVFGVQWQPTENLHFGALVRTPQTQFFSSGKIHHQLQLTDDGGFTAAIFDENPQIDYQTPLQTSLGLAWQTPAWSVEWNISAYSGIGTYAPFSSEEPWMVAERDVMGGTTERRLAAQTQFYSPELTITTSLGGRVRLRNDFWWHGGFRYDPSSLPGSGLEVDLFHVTSGVSLIKGNTATSLGVHLGFGSGDNRNLSDIAGTQLVSGDVQYFSMGLVFATNFFF